MENESFESLIDYKLNNNIEVYEVLRTKNESKKFKLVPIETKMNETESLFYFNKPKFLFEFLYGVKLNEDETSESTPWFDPFEPNEENRKKYNSLPLINAMAKFIAKKELTPLGKGGAHGIAYKLGNNVLKITDDLKEIENCIKLLGKTNERLSNIYKTYVIKYGNPDNEIEELKEAVQIYYAIEQEFINDIGLNKKLGQYQFVRIIGVKPDLRSLDESIREAYNTGNKEELETIKNSYLNIDMNEKDGKLITVNTDTAQKVRLIGWDILMELCKNNINSSDYTVSENIGIKSTNNKICYLDLGGAMMIVDKRNGKRKRFEKFENDINNKKVGIINIDKKIV